MKKIDLSLIFSLILLFFIGCGGGSGSVATLKHG